MEATEVETLDLGGQALREQAAMAEATVQVEVEVLPIGGETKILQSKALK